MTSQTQRHQTLADHCRKLSAGCDVDCTAVERWEIDLPTLRRLAEAYRMGWLNNVMGRITPITMRRKEDYVIMADLFIQSEKAANSLLEKFQADLELFCQMAGIHLTPTMTFDTMPRELQSHLELYMRVANLLAGKFKIEIKNPLAEIYAAPLDSAVSADQFITSFLDLKFPERKAVGSKLN